MLLRRGCKNGIFLLPYWRQTNIWPFSVFVQMFDSFQRKWDKFLWWIFHWMNLLAKSFPFLGKWLNVSEGLLKPTASSAQLHRIESVITVAQEEQGSCLCNWPLVLSAWLMIASWLIQQHRAENNVCLRDRRGSSQEQRVTQLFKEPVNKEFSESDMTEVIIRNVQGFHSGLIQEGGVLSLPCVYRSAYACLFLEGALDAQGQFGITQLSVNFKMIKSGVGLRLPEPWERRLDVTGGGGRTVEQQQTVISAVGATPQCPIQSKESHLVG